MTQERNRKIKVDLSAFFSEDSGGMLFDFPYAPTQIVTLLSACKSVMGMAMTLTGMVAA
jgi:hypothetical protein